MNYFENCTTLAELKQRLHILAFRHHPDLSGYDSTSIMQDINGQYAAAIKRVTVKHEHDNTNTYRARSKDQPIDTRKMAHVIRASLPRHIIVEIVGTWIWVTATQRGDNATIFFQSQNLHLRWQSRRKKWYWRPNNSTRYSKQYSKQYSPRNFDDIRKRYGSTKL